MKMNMPECTWDDFAGFECSCPGPEHRKGKKRPAGGTMKKYLVTSPAMPHRTFVVYAETSEQAHRRFSREYPLADPHTVFCPELGIT